MQPGTYSLCTEGIMIRTINNILSLSIIVHLSMLRSLCFSCNKCEELSSVWQRLAEIFNQDEDSEIAIAKADCTTTEDVCRSKRDL